MHDEPESIVQSSELFAGVGAASQRALPEFRTSSAKARTARKILFEGERRPLQMSGTQPDRSGYEKRAASAAG